MSDDKNKTAAPAKVVPMNPEQPQQAEVFVVPAPIWAAVVQRLGKLKWEKVHDLMPVVSQVRSQMINVEEPPKG